MWPGFGENMRVLQWIVERCEGSAKGKTTPLGIMPAYEDLSWKGLEKFTPDQYAQLSGVEHDAWVEELHSHDELLGKLGAYLPGELEVRRTLLHQKLAA
jgi:phosphoenolpyruvate carboxykinase (GTP)